MQHLGSIMPKPVGWTQNFTASYWMPLMIGSGVIMMSMFRSVGSPSQCGSSRPGSFWQPPGSAWREHMTSNRGLMEAFLSTGRSEISSILFDRSYLRAG